MYVKFLVVLTLKISLIHEHNYNPLSPNVCKIHHIGRDLKNFGSRYPTFPYIFVLNEMK